MNALAALVVFIDSVGSGWLSSVIWARTSHDGVRNMSMVDSIRPAQAGRNPRRTSGTSGAGVSLRDLGEADAKISVPLNRPVPEEIFEALESFPWPPCRSRANVRPDGQDKLEAFCVGVVHAYNMGLTRSRMTKIMKNLTKLLVIFSQSIPSVSGIRFTTVQLNRNYASKLHVDANNQGTSWIIGLGPYGEGFLWLMNVGGEKLNQDDVAITVTEPLRGYQFKKGDVIHGRVHDIRGKWFEFDGRIPHATMPYQDGPRISLVFFCRKNCDKINQKDRSLAVWD